MDTLCIGVFLLIGGIFYLLLSPLLGPSEDERLWAEQQWRANEAKIRLAETRAEQIPIQTEGIRQRYRMTQENRVNAMIRQTKQELEIEKLKEQIKLLKQSTGTSEPFTPDE